MNVFELFAKISLDSSEYDKGLGEAASKAESDGSKIGGALQSGLGKMAKAGVAALAGAEAAVGAFTKSAIGVGMEFDSQMSKVSAISGATGDEFAQLRDKALEMGAATKYTSTEAGEAFEYMGMAGWNAEQMLSGISPILDLATASGADLGTTSDIVTDALTAFGLTAEDSAHFADLLAVASTDANTDVLMMGETFKYVAPVVGGMYDDAEKAAEGAKDAALAIGLMANSGIKSSQAGTSLRSILTRLETDAGASSKSLGALGTMTEVLGVQFYNTDGSIRDLSDVIMDSREAWKDLTTEEQANIAKKIAGQNAISGWNALMNASDEDVKKLTADLEDSDGAVQQMADTMRDNLQGDMEAFQSAIYNSKVALSDALTPSLREFVQFGTEGIGAITQAFQEGGLSGAMDAFGTVLADGLNMLIEGLPQMIDAGMQLLGALGQGLLDNMPVITEAATNIILMLVEGLITALPGLAEGAIQIITGLATGIGEALPELIPAMLEAVLTIAQGLIDNIDLIIDAALQLVTGLAEGILNGLPILLEKLPELIGGLVEGILAAIPKIVEAGYRLFTALIQDLPSIISAIIGVLPHLISEIVIGLLNGAAKIVEGGVKLLSSIVEDLPTIISNIITAIPKIITELVKGFINNSGDIIKAGVELIRALAKGLIQAIPTLIVAAPMILLGIVKGLVDSAKIIIDAGKDIIKNIGDGIKQSIDDAKQWGKDMIDNFIKGIKDKINAVRDAVKGIAKTVKDILGFSEPKEGPLSNFHTYAPDMMELFAKGIRDNERIIDDQLKKSFNFSDVIVNADTPTVGGGNLINPTVGQVPQPLTVILELDKAQFARTVFDLNKAETQRMGVALANV